MVIGQQELFHRQGERRTLQPFLTPIAARLSPRTAHLIDPPVSTTSTLPFPSSSSACAVDLQLYGVWHGPPEGFIAHVCRTHSLFFQAESLLTARTRGLFSKHFTVAAWPENLRLPPKSLQRESGTQVPFGLHSSTSSKATMHLLESRCHDLNFGLHDDVDWVGVVHIAKICSCSSRHVWWWHRCFRSSRHTTSSCTPESHRSGPLDCVAKVLVMLPFSWPVCDVHM